MRFECITQALALFQKVLRNFEGCVRIFVLLSMWKVISVEDPSSSRASVKVTMELTMKSMGYQRNRVQASDSHQQNFHEAGIAKRRLRQGSQIRISS
ncbi:hypothetical protein K1719_016333 [Acacia pycnantha]|nr:hypothetical protein K1719_016333 [Acacia pycnantha]